MITLMINYAERFKLKDSKKDLAGDEALDEVNKHIKEAFDILKRETNKLRKERNAFEEVAKKLEHVHFSTMLKLNVGGHFFSTRLATMTKDPGSMLHTMFSGRFDTKPGEDGSYFIDPDGTHFRHILNYLRTGKLVLPDDKVVRKELLSEAEFYRIDGILNELKAKPFKCSFVSAMLIEYRPLLTLCQKSLVIFFYILGA
nr:BTB/POZ domain-containing protein KCTD21-like [Pocillopora verrucosa]